MVIVLACHPCQSVDALLFDGQRIRLDANGCSFTPDQQTITISSISRTNGVVTVALSSSITDLQTGDTLLIKDVSNATFNGRYSVTVVDATHFTYTCGASDISLSANRAGADGLARLPGESAHGSAARKSHRYVSRDDDGHAL
jgi:hypothetical protein